MRVFGSKERMFFVGLFLVLLVGGCSSQGDKTELKMNFPNATWNRFAVMDTAFTINNINKLYDVKVYISVADGFEHASIPIEMVITSPDGQENIINKIVVFKDKEGKHIGNVFGNTWTIEQLIYSGKEFYQEGRYGIFLQNRSQYYDLLGVESLTFTVVKSDIKKEK